MSSHATTDVSADGSTITIAVMLTGEQADPEYAALVLRNLTRAGVEIDFAQGSAVLGAYTSFTEAHRSIVDEFVSSQ